MSRFADKKNFYSIEKSIDSTQDNVFDLIHKGNYTAVSYKIKIKGESSNTRNTQDQTLLHYALIYNQVEIAKLLISSGANLNAEDKLGETPIDIITRSHELSSVFTSEEILALQQQNVEYLGSSDDNSCCCIC